MSLMDEEPQRAELEDGQLTDSDVADLDYTPLERPENYKPYLNPVSLMSMNIQDDHTDESEHEPSSDLDSDSDNCGKPAPKKRKVKIKRLRKSESMESTTKPSKYNIWCKTVQEDTLAEDLLVCDVTKNYLGIEAYHHHRLHEDNTMPLRDMDTNDDRRSSTENRFNNKRRYRDRRNARLRLERRPSYDSDNERGDARLIPDLIVNVESSVTDIAADIAAKLCEEKDNLILRIVEFAGKEKAIELFKETKRIEEDGGMIVRNNTRRRTPGGVFIFLLKRDKHVTQDTVNKIFIEDKLQNKEKLKSRFKYRNKKVEELKQSLADSVLPAIRTRAEKWVAAQTTAEDQNHVSNPPPSPATDGRDGSSDVDTNQLLPSPHHNISYSNGDNFLVTREAAVLSKMSIARSLTTDPRANSHTTYDDDYLDIGCGDDMDLF